MRIQVLYDNERVEPDLTTGWGFAALADGVLFDTGDDGEALRENMAALGVSPRDIETVVLSHGHADHTGGLSAVVAENPNVTVVVPTTDLETTVRSTVPESVTVTVATEPQTIREGIVTTGAVGTAPSEQGLVCTFERGAILVTGCAHPGVDALLDAAREVADVRGVVGGFHDVARLEGLESLEYISPCHCTRRKRVIAERFPETCVRCGAGLVIDESSLA